ncbi:prolyl oligopeptidase family protein [Mariniflexile fucanivorans]|uniref:Prolyl oligopeptidase family protein n=1 Tax=Mariniflexile fucanivorans TaxID=264023 RepID=A0A4R1RDA0_9FLAO|nr:alpha/beta fold hydrolase [Mariniflexile fucanivorans]TCL63590.1 prolyl oligopeptidase family protein [Mariniflexile fucanivorans]
MLTQKHIAINGKHQKPIVIDVTYIENKTNLPVIIFCHGYKGFKDWGAWNVMAKQFANEGFCFVKFNFSYNGGTVEQPIDFPDLEAFGNNNYTKELDDLETVIDWIFNNDDIKTITDANNLSLIGHSRGGGITAIKAEEDNRIAKLISLASVSDFGNRMGAKQEIESWKKTGVKYVENGRTHQQMPHFYQFYEDFKANEERLTIKRAVSNLKIPHLIIHGNDDTSVLLNEANQLHNWNSKSKLEIIDGANHVFGASHPWGKDDLPEHLKEVVSKVIVFLK